MAGNDYVYVPLSFEYLMSALFGKSHYHGYVGSVSKKAWKKDLAKVAKYIRTSIELNVQTDQHHKDTLRCVCEDLERKIKESSKVEQINVIVIENLIRLIFLLLGNLPDHWRYKSPYADRFWKLDGHRSITHLHSESQKAALIINLIDIKKRFSVPTNGYEDLHDVCFRKFRGNAQAFVEWFKAEQPQVYCQIF